MKGPPKLSDYQTRIVREVRKGKYLTGTIGGYYWPRLQSKPRWDTVVSLLRAGILIETKRPTREGGPARRAGIMHKAIVVDASEFAIQ